MVRADVAAFGRELARRLAGALDGGLVGAYFVGSVALGGYVPGESDVDIVAVSEDQLPVELKPLIAAAVLESATACPTRGLEFTLYRRDVAGAPPRGADFEVNANEGPRMPRSIHLDHRTEPGFWYILDRAIAHRAGITIVGPPAGRLLDEIARDALLDAMKNSMRWHRDHEGATLYSVPNACRAWRFAAEDALGSKLEGAAWAKPRWAHPELIDSAVALRYGNSADFRHLRLTSSWSTSRASFRAPLRSVVDAPRATWDEEVRPREAPFQATAAAAGSHRCPLERYRASNCVLCRRPPVPPGARARRAGGEQPDGDLRGSPAMPAWRSTSEFRQLVQRRDHEESGGRRAVVASRARRHRSAAKAGLRRDGGDEVPDPPHTQQPSCVGARFQLAGLYPEAIACATVTDCTALVTPGGRMNMLGMLEAESTDWQALTTAVRPSWRLLVAGADLGFRSTGRDGES
jgi:hypothetical protein